MTDHVRLSTRPGIPAQDHAVRELLEQLWRERVAQIAELSVALHEAPDDADSADGIAAQDERLATSAAIDSAREMQQELEAALARLDEGRFGICEGCGGAISPERLEALPHARLCVRCQAGRR